MKNVKTMSKLMIFALILGIHAIYSTDSFASIKGNIIGSENIVDVADAITSLRICSGINLNPNDNSDLNEDNMIGLEEAIFALQVASGIKEQAVFGQLQQLLDDSVKNSKVPGAVLQIRTPSVQWVGAAGLSSVRNQIPMKTSDLLRIASMTKVFVSTVVLSLHEKGKLNIESSIQTYLSKEIVEKLSYQDQDIKIINLLNMTSGILDYVAIDAYNDDVEENPNRQTSWMPEELLEYVFNIYSDKYSADYEYFVSQGDIFEPGSAFKYSNTNYILLEMIVNKVSDHSLSAEIRRIISNPLELKNTFMEIHESREGGFGGLFVRGYRINEIGEIEDVTEINDALGLGDGGLISDAYGLADFLNAMFKEQTILSTRMLEQMTNFDPYGHHEDYGLGLSYMNTNFGAAWGHNGTSSGFQGDMFYLIEKELIFVLLTNCEDESIFDSLFNSSLNLLYQ